MADEQQQSQTPAAGDPNVTVEPTQPAAAAPPAAPAPPVAAAPVAEAAPAEQPKPTPYPLSSKPGGCYWGTGRRKTSVARVRLRPGAGKIEINGRGLDDYFHELKDRNAVTAALRLTDTQDKFDVFANVLGGGFTGQAGAILLGVARALLTVSDAFEPKLRDSGFLTRDSRMKERKKYGQKGARKRFQFSKR